MSRQLGYECLSMKACVVFDSRFGNTEKVARSLGAGLSESGVRTVMVGTKAATEELLKASDLLCFGAPTEAFTSSKPMKDFLRRLRKEDLNGKLGFVFDTKLNSRLSGSAGKYIETELLKLGVVMAAPRESAAVSVFRRGPGVAGATLLAGEEERFRDVGLKLGTGLIASQVEA